MEIILTFGVGVVAGLVMRHVWSALRIRRERARRAAPIQVIDLTVERERRKR
jgi:hypothetical protein